MLNPNAAPDTPENAPDEGASLDDFLDLHIDLEGYLPDAVAPAWHFMQDYPVLLVAVMFVLGYGAGKGLQWLIRSSLSHAVTRTQTTLDDKLIDYLTAPVVQTMVILALVAAEKAFVFGESVDWFLTRLLFTLLLFLWGRAWFKAIALLISTFAGKSKGTGLMQPRTRPLFEMSVKVLLIGVLIWLFMALWNIDGTAWLASAGVIGIAVGFAARDTLANLISGVSIIADAPYKLGDYVVLDTGERGVVTELGMRSTRLLTRDDVEISIPNAVMGMAKITNESGGPAVEHRIRIPIGVAYGTRPAAVVELLEQVAKDDPLILDHPVPRVRMRAFGESSLDFELLGWIKYPEQRGLARHNLLVEIESRFAEAGIRIPFPQRDVHLSTPQQVSDSDSG
ncbi:MAG: mechanosensitive ion channel family protein [Xanthomonadales bacterium]|jgi:small-conductance mechanosensitive channel|nr:mechanosensitive ion channel family protein [Xanthomonadales bacterium]